MLVVTAFLACAATSSAQVSSSTTTGLSNTMNPAISANGLFLGQTDFKNGNREVNGIGLQEAELQFSAVVDPFWKAVVIVAVYPEGSGGDYGLSVEEANITSTALPAGLALQLGKFFLPFGKHSPLHTHHFPFIAAPGAVEELLGEGLTDAGLLLAATPPLPWFSDVMAFVVDGTAEIFNGSHRDPAYGGRWVNLWDVSDESTLELGGSVLYGQASVDFFGLAGGRTVYGADVTFKWISSTRSHGPAVTFQNEILLSDFGDYPDRFIGGYTMLQYRFHRNWWLGMEHGQVDIDRTSLSGPIPSCCEDRREYKLNFTFTPSEFSALRLETTYLDNSHGDDDLRLALQWNFTIGSHPAHLY
jgi:hypothetical protein